MKTRSSEMSRRRMLHILVATSAGVGASLLAACGAAATTATAATTTSAASSPAALPTAETTTATNVSVSTTAATSSTATALPTSTATASSATSSAAAPSAAATVAGAATTVQVLDGWGDGPWTKELYAGWTQGLTKILPGVNVEFIIVPAAFKGGPYAKTTAMIASGTLPDFTIPTNQDFALQGALLDLQPYFNRDKEVTTWQFYKPCEEVVNITLDDGHPMLWAFPGNSDARVIYLNLDLLQNAGITYDPAQNWDWPTFEKHAQALTKRASDGTIQQLGFSGLWNYGDPNVLAQYAGGDYFARDPQTGWDSKATFSAPGTQQGLSFYQKLMVEDKVGQLPNDKFAGGFTSGNVAMTPSWSSFLSSLTATTNPKLQHFKWDVMGFPVENSGDPWPHQFANGSSMGSLLKGAKHLDEGFQIGKYLIGDGHLVRMQAMGVPPIVSNNATQQAFWKQRSPNTHYSEIYSAVMAKGSIGTWSKIKYHTTEFMALYSKNITELLNGTMGVHDFGAAMDAATTPLILHP